jgi:hypothetical protein
MISFAGTRASEQPKDVYNYEKKKIVSDQHARLILSQHKPVAILLTDPHVVRAVPTTQLIEKVLVFFELLFLPDLVLFVNVGNILVESSFLIVISVCTECPGAS